MTYICLHTTDYSYKLVFYNFKIVLIYELYESSPYPIILFLLRGIFIYPPFYTLVSYAVSSFHVSQLTFCIHILSLPGAIYALPISL